MCRMTQHTTARYIPRPRREAVDRARLRLEVARRKRLVVSEAGLPQATPMTDDVATTATLNHEV